MKRFFPIETNSIHHIYTKSIYRYKIFTSRKEYARFLELMRFYQLDGHTQKYSKFIQRPDVLKHGFGQIFQMESIRKTKLVEFGAYCLMPTHIHFLLKQTQTDGIQTFMERLLNAYSRFFNLRHNRRGPLWEHRYGNNPICSMDQLKTAAEYIHNNPVKDLGMQTPAQWPYSSVHEYLKPTTPQPICCKTIFC